MSSIDLGDPRTYWLTLTNIGLGLAVLGGLGVLLYAIGREWLDRVRQRRRPPGIEGHPFRGGVGVRLRGQK